MLVKRIIFGGNYVILAWINNELLHKQAKFPKIVKMAKITLKVKVNDTYFPYQVRVSKDACLVLIWWSQPMSLMSYCTDKPNFLQFWVKMAKMTLKVKGNYTYFEL